jgi:hypothetical protein
MDCAWGEPLDPIWEWSGRQVHMPDTWFADYPDTFALIPRNLSDGFYDLDPLLHPEVICLGEPIINRSRSRSRIIF